MLGKDHTDAPCPCGRSKHYEQCCGALHEAIRALDKDNDSAALVMQTASPEDLMRSRYSAYVCKDYEYVLQTYAAQPRDKLSADELEQHAKNTHWRALEVTEATGDVGANEQVTFKVYYQVAGEYFLMHERSNFIKEQGVYRYETGEILSATGKIDVGRNSPCPCQSGKKFKRCCG